MGRGSGKTRAGTEWVRAQVESGRCGRIALVAPTAADARDVMVEGESGLLSVCPPWNRPLYEPSKRRVTWPNGAMATLYSADEPERLRGPQHDCAYVDEIAAFRYPEAWDQMLFGLRLGTDPRVVVTTTPRPTKLVKELLAHPTTVVTRGTSYENRQNLAPAFFDAIIARYQGTRMGRQEILAEVLEDVEGALWSRALLDEHRVSAHPDLTRVVVAIDPAVTATEGSDETGIVVAGQGSDGDFYVLDDRSLKASPQRWASIAVTAYHTYACDRIVAETNNGGDMVESTLRTIDENVAFRKVTATRGKQLRAEPIAALFEQGRCHMVGSFPRLEDQLCEWCPGDPSPDRLDAMTWALTELSAGGGYALPVTATGEARDSFIQPDPFGSGWNGGWR